MSVLGFLVEMARYGASDPRSAALGVPAGSSLRVDDPVLGLNQTDLILVLDIRASTNLRIRLANERAMARWAKQVTKETLAAQRTGRLPVLVPAPTLREEVVAARTIQEFGVAVKAMLTAAFGRGVITYQPWTQTVSDEVPWVGIGNHTVGSVHTRSQVQQLAGGMTSFVRVTSDEDSQRFEATGERFSALIGLAGGAGPRVEELIAIRDDWVQLNDPDPHIVLKNAEVFVTTEPGVRERRKVELKHRQPGEQRILHLTPDEAESLRVHRRKFVTFPDTASADEDLRNPYFFTTHRGGPIDPNNWNERWYQPAAALTFTSPGDVWLATVPFRRLRAAAVTDWLVHGATLEFAARKAGNSQWVLERRYKGVIDEVLARRGADVSAGSLPGAAATLSLHKRDLTQLAAQRSAIDAEIRALLDATKAS